MATKATITETQLQHYWELDQKRKSLERTARQIEAEQKLLAKDFRASLAVLDKAEITRGDFRLELREGPAYVAWKEEFIRVAGSAAAIAAQEAALPSERLTVTRLGE